MPDELPPLSSFEHAQPPLSSFEHEGGSLTPGEIASDVGKSAASGALIDFPIGMVGLPGDVGSMLNRGIDWGLGKAADVTGVEALRPTPQPEREGGPMLGSQQIRRGLESIYGGPLGHEPQSIYGQYARSVGEFAPMALTGPGGFTSRMLRQAAVPGILSEGAGQFTAGTPYEPYARAAGALAGGIPGVAKGERAVAEASRAKLGEDIVKGRKEFYQTMDRATTDIPVDWKLQSRLKNQVLADFQAKQIFPFNSKAAFDALDDLGQVKDVAGLISWLRATRADLYKKGLSNSAQIITDATHAAIDTAMPAHLPASGFLKMADREFAISKMLENLGGRLEKAEGQTAGANSAMNLDNKIRQALEKFKEDKRAWHSLDQTQQFKVNQIIDGKWDVNALRWASNWLGGGGGMGHLVSSYIIGSIFGKSIGGGAFALGPLLKRWENRLTQNRAHNLLGEIAEQSTFAQGGRLRPPSLYEQLPRTSLYGALAPQLTSEGYPYYQGR